MLILIHKFTHFRWTVSQAKKDGVEAAISKYDGQLDTLSSYLFFFKFFMFKVFLSQASASPFF